MAENNPEVGDWWKPDDKNNALEVVAIHDGIQEGVVNRVYWLTTGTQHRFVSHEDLINQWEYVDPSLITNVFQVQLVDDKIKIGNPPKAIVLMNKKKALVLAAWLVHFADPETQKFMLTFQMVEEFAG